MEAHEVYNFKDETGKGKGKGKGKGNCGLGGDAARRKRLADISNLPQQSKAANRESKRQQTFSEEYVKQLQKEKEAAHVASLAERDSELEKVRVTVQKMQQQNLQLAQAHSQSLAELNNYKDWIKILQHELACTKGILKAKETELECKAKSEIHKKNEDALVNISEAVESSQVDKNYDFGPYSDKQVQIDGNTDNKRIGSRQHSSSFKSNELEPYGDMCETAEDKLWEGIIKTEIAAENFEAAEKYREHYISRTRQQSRNQAVISSSDKRIQAKEKIVEKRTCSRRRTARSKSKDVEPPEDTVEMNDSQFPVSVLPVGTDSLTSSVKTEDCDQDRDPRHIGTLQRPSRQAARKVQSYKEIPLNVKMRRPD